MAGAQDAVRLEICDLAHRTAGETGRYVLAPEEEKVIS